ncbi:SURF1 family protein [Aurantimonas marianensis]|uniref:SURF1-like protein n=1 Tax=Aurantimonas marianensis TaxID=2920428 RepID=A0A9X2KJ35_9HYPH|nr:SURF1 family protein [Aurantimonas marianensis]
MTGDTAPVNPGAKADARGRMPRGRFWLALGGCLVGIAILVVLGTWQVERLHWKEGLIARIEQRAGATPIDLDTLVARFAETGDVDYTPVTAEGRFLHEGERYFLSTFEGQAGWNVYTPFLTTGSDILFVNRGFVPYEMRDPSTRTEGQLKERVTITGLARNAPDRKSGYFVPDNDPAKRTFYWRDLGAMAEGLTLASGARLLPFFVDAGPGRAPGGWPVGGTTVVDIPNSHLQYAVTWYGLAFVLAVMTILLVVRDRRAARPAAGASG